MAVVAKTDKMICPQCKVEMNHHCDKIVYNVDAHEAGKTDPGLGGSSRKFIPVPSAAVAPRATLS